MRRTYFMRFLPVLVALLGARAVGAEYDPFAGSYARVDDPAAIRVIVKFRGAAEQRAQQASAAGEDVTALAGRTGVALRERRRIQSHLRVLEVGALAAPGSLGVALSLLRADHAVEYAEIDQVRYAHAVPNDPLFGGQWYLQNATTTPSAVDAVTAWDVTTGSSGVVIAVLDTGVRYDHEDLMPAGEGGRLLPGYDFITDARRANDGDGWDLDASDPGDATTASDSCGAGGSSWHGTRVSGVIGARSNNGTGVSGLTWSGWILPVRVLGKCGGTDSDIVAAMLWAGGIAVGGAPANPYPARVVNLSLGGSGRCPLEYADAVQQLRSRGVLVVASAGNEGTVVEAPADCPGVAGVAAIRHIGTKVGFSNLGPEIALSAPGGNCVNTGAGEPCLYSIDTTVNLGTQGPAANGYTDQYNFNVGTSFSAPIVSGIAGLMVAVNARLTTDQLVARLREGASKPFPVSSDPAVPTCHVPADPSDVQTVECNCTTDTCGAGMANARGAVEAALRPVAAVLVQGAVSPGQNVTLGAGGSGAACGRGVVAYSWTIVSGTPPSGIVGADTSTAVVVAPSSGSYTVRLTVTDDTGSEDSADVVVTPTAATTSAPASAGSVACPAPVVAISLSPLSASVQANGGTQAFTASVANAGSSGVNWYVNDVPGGNATLGTISSSGTYAAPARVPTPSSVTIKAVPVADASRYASAQVTITPAPGGSGGGGGGGGGGGVSDGIAMLLLVASGLWRRWRGQPGGAR